MKWKGQHINPRKVCGVCYRGQYIAIVETKWSIESGAHITFHSQACFLKRKNGGLRIKDVQRPQLSTDLCLLCAIWGHIG